MPHRNRLHGAISPYLRAHASNPVDWWQWGHDAFEEAARRDVPVFISIGYATCHWCHVMARESFSDDHVAASLNEHFVSIKVDREEHPDVDSSYLAQASAFTRNLGWPLSIFATPEGRTFYAGTYFPTEPVRGHPSFLQVLEAVTDAWMNRRDEAIGNGAAVIEAVRASMAMPTAQAGLGHERLLAAAETLAGQEDALYGGFGTAPKFPVAPVLQFLQETGGESEQLAARTLERMAASPLRDPVEGGFFRYATMRDWTQPHYERMLYDNALLLRAYARAWVADQSRHWAARTAAGIAGFLMGVLQQPGGGYASGQDSESTIAGERSEGGYYERDALERSTLESPPIDEKILTGWNGLAIGSMAKAGSVFGQPSWIESARRAADYLLATHVDDERMLVRASISSPDDGHPMRSSATATLEDYGMFAGALIDLSLATGAVAYASEAKRLLDATLVAGEASRSIMMGGADMADVGSTGQQTVGPVFAVPGGGDPVLVAHNLALAADPSEGAYPSGLSACATAAYGLYLVSGHSGYRDAAKAAIAPLGPYAIGSPIAYGASLSLAVAVEREPKQLVVVTTDDRREPGTLTEGIRGVEADVVAVVTETQAREFAENGFDLFEARAAIDGQPTLYLCTGFVCKLPLTGDDAVEALTASSPNDFSDR